MADQTFNEWMIARVAANEGITLSKSLISLLREGDAASTAGEPETACPYPHGSEEQRIWIEAWKKP